MVNVIKEAKEYKITIKEYKSHEIKVKITTQIRTTN